jgi:hypothetical protein
MDLATLGGTIGALIVLALPALYFIVRALQGGLPSRRLANFGLACGLGAFIMPETLFRLSPADYPLLFVAIGITRVALGLAGLVLVGLAMSRRSDGGVGSFRLLAGSLLSVLHAMIGTAALLYADVAAPGTPQIYSAPDGAFQLTLPSRRWEKVQRADSVVAFAHTLPDMQARVRTLSRDQNESDFDALAQLMIERIDSFPRTKGKLAMEDGTTPDGCSYRYFSGLDETRDGEPVYAAYSVVWNPRTKVLLEISFEGLPKMKSRAGKDAELRTIQEAARTICLSAQ